jgi:hypothetical protein
MVLSADNMASKEGKIDETVKSHVTTKVEVEQGHVDELCLDTNEDIEYDYDSERSPFAEGLY